MIRRVLIGGIWGISVRASVMDRICGDEIAGFKYRRKNMDSF